MGSCVLCLELKKNILDCITVDSIQWKEQNLARAIEKHFWPLNTIQVGSWICLSCWRQLAEFHKFYLCIEEAHAKLLNIKLESEGEKLSAPKSIFKDEEDASFCFLEPKQRLDQKQKRDLAEPEILIDHHPTHDIAVDKDTSLVQEELGVEDMPLKQAFKRLRGKCNLKSRDPLENSKKFKKTINLRGKVNAAGNHTENNEMKTFKVKEDPIDSNDNCLCSINYIDVSDVNYQPDKDDSETSETKNRKVYGKHRTSQKENDKFIAEHFKQMFCDLCQTPFKDFTAIQKHFNKTHKQRGYVVCCKIKLLNRTRLVDHLHRHLNPDHFKCTECGKALSDRISFDSHMLVVHKANEVVRRHCCTSCGKSFTKAYKLRIHKLTHLPEDEKKFPCTDCGRNYGSPYLLNQHRQVVHLKRFVKVCYICGKEINSSAEFKTHMDKHEGIPLPVINCDVCGLRLTSKRGLKLHKLSQHPVGGKKDHPCPLCEKISPTAIALKKHIVTMHEKGYDYKCNYCDKEFRRADKLKEHIATHTGTPLYSCPWCPKTFNSNGNMHSHRQNKHPKEYLELKMQKYNPA